MTFSNPPVALSTEVRGEVRRIAKGHPYTEFVDARIILLISRNLALPNHLCREKRPGSLVPTHTSSKSSEMTPALRMRCAQMAS